MTMIALGLILVIVVFIVAFLSPQSGTHVQTVSARMLKQLKSHFSSWPQILRKLIGKPPTLTEHAVERSARVGKKSRKHIGSKDSRTARTTR